MCAVGFYPASPFDGLGDPIIGRMKIPPPNPNLPAPALQLPPPPTPSGHTAAFWAGVCVSCLIIAFAGMLAVLVMWMVSLILCFPRRTRIFGGGILYGTIPGAFLGFAFWAASENVFSLFPWILFAGSLAVIAYYSNSKRITQAIAQPPIQKDKSQSKGVVVGLAPLSLLILFGGSDSNSLVSSGAALWFLLTVVLFVLGLVCFCFPQDRKFAQGLLLGSLASIILGVPGCLLT